MTTSQILFKQHTDSMNDRDDIDIKHLIEFPNDYRVLRRITPRQMQHDLISWLEGFDSNKGDLLVIGILDFETTGFEVERSDPIELGIVTIAYSPSQGKFSILDAINEREQPKAPLPPIITQITGLTDDDLEGKTFNDELIIKALGRCDFLLAHNAKFDRAFFDKRFPSLAQMVWLCSASDIPWDELGYESRKLEYLLFRNGWFYQGHQALMDCYAVAQLLKLNPYAIDHMVKVASTPTFVLEAHGVPFAHKDMVKERGYRWDGAKRVWCTQGEEAYIKQEQMFLHGIEGVNIDLNTVYRIDPVCRFK